MNAPPSLAATNPAEVLRRLQLTVNRRLDGMLMGDYQGLVPGHGSELGETRLYEPGDDVRRIDWNVTARMQTLHLRETIADRELELTLVVDASPSLAFGTARTTKRDLLVAATVAVGTLAGRSANRIGAVIATGQGSTTLASRSGRPGLAATLHRIIACTPPDGSGPIDLADALNHVVRITRRRGMVVVLSDFLVGGAGGFAAPPGAPTPGSSEDRGAPAPRPGRGAGGFAAPPGAAGGWERGLRGLAHKHEVLAIEVVDPRELELPAVGLLELVDPETGRTRTVNTDARLRRRYAEAAAAQREAIAASVRRSGAAHLVLRTDRDWLVDLARFVASRRRRGSGLTGGRVRA